MKELSLHILDLVQNSITANATLIEIIIKEKTEENTLTIILKDNGKGMDEEFLQKVCDPFTTTRTTRKVGLGIPLFMYAAKACNGCFEIKSEPGKGTEVTATFQHNHIDREPVGDMAQTFATIVMGAPNLDFTYIHEIDSEKFNIDTREIKKVLGSVPINSIDVICWIKENINEELQNIYGGN